MGNQCTKEVRYAVETIEDVENVGRGFYIVCRHSGKFFNEVKHVKQKFRTLDDVHLWPALFRPGARYNQRYSWLNHTRHAGI